MASSSLVIGEMPIGNKRITYGSFTNTGSEQTCEVITGLIEVENFEITPKGSSVLTNACTVYETFPLLSSTGEVSVTIICDAGVDGYWRAIGY